MKKSYFLIPAFISLAGVCIAMWFAWQTFNVTLHPTVTRGQQFVLMSAMIAFATMYALQAYRLASRAFGKTPNI